MRHTLSARASPYATSSTPRPNHMAAWHGLGQLSASAPGWTLPKMAFRPSEWTCAYLAPRIGKSGSSLIAAASEARDEEPNGSMMRVSSLIW